MKPQKKQAPPALAPKEGTVEIGSPTNENRWLPEGRADRFVFIAAISGLAVVLYLLFFFDARRGLIDANIVGKIRTDNSVRRRHAKTLNWHDVKGQDTIYLRDIVYTPKDTLAVVTFNDGRTLELKPDSMVQFDEITIDGIQITLFDFSQFRLIPYPKTVRSTLLDDPKPLELRHSEYTQRLGDRLRRNLNLDKFRPLTDPPLLLNRLSDYAIILVRPENKVYNIKINRWIQTVWTPIPLDNLRLELHISRDTKFRRFLTHRPKGHKLLVQFDLPGEYFWRVKAAKGPEFIYSNIGAFTFAEDRGMKKRTLLTAPNENQKETPRATKTPDADSSGN